MSRIIIVTGGSEGIGYAVAERFARAGDKVVITSRRESEGRGAEKKLREAGEVSWVRADVSVEKDCIGVIEFTEKLYGHVDVLVNNAGITGLRGDLIEQSMENIENVLKINVMGTIQMMKYAALVMKDRGKGVIVNIGSLCGVIANPESIAYHASKGAIRMVTQSAARELSPFGIRVVSVAPGWVATPLLKKIMIEPDPEATAHGQSLHMAGQIIEPEQIAGAVYLVSDDEASAINGCTVMADDGYSSFKI